MNLRSALLPLCLLAALPSLAAARGTDAGRAVRTELGAAISKVAIEDLPKLKAQADAAMAAGVVGAKEFQAAVAAVNLQRLGVDIDAIKTGFTAAGRSAVEAFRGAVEEVDDLGLTVEQRSAAIAQAFDNAFKQASTSSRRRPWRLRHSRSSRAVMMRMPGSRPRREA